MIAKRSDLPSGRHWRGPDGGRRRGSAVDAQVSKLAGVSADKRFASKMLNLTRLIFCSLSLRGLEPLMGQRAVCSEVHRVGTAIDLLCFNSSNNSLVIVEIKCGHSQGRTAAALLNKKSCKMKTPLHRAPDTVLNRHMAQLTLTHHLFMREKETLKSMSKIGINEVEALLLYANDSAVEVYELDGWWKDRGRMLLDALA